VNALNLIRFSTKNLWSAAQTIKKRAKRANERLADVQHDCDPIHVYSISGLGIGPDVTVVVRLDERTR